MIFRALPGQRALSVCALAGLSLAFSEWTDAAPPELIGQHKAGRTGADNEHIDRCGDCHSHRRTLDLYVMNSSLNMDASALSSGSI